jgi:hypothetical protein
VMTTVLAGKVYVPGVGQYSGTGVGTITGPDDVGFGVAVVGGK